MRRYGSEAKGRWVGFEHRPGDIVISTRSKCGTTWVQMICALLVFQDPSLPAPLAELSPWLDWDVETVDVVRDRLARQHHRRFIKTHAPLDGLPLHPGVTYLVIGRRPLDVAVSLYHHSHNIDRDRFAALTGRRTAAPSLPLDEWLPHWIEPDVGPEEQLDTLPGLLHHVSDAWDRRDELNVVLLHYADLMADTEGEMRRLARLLGIEVAEDRWPVLVEAASFASMKASAATSVPDQLGVLKDADAFFRSGTSGGGDAILDAAGRRRYADQLQALASPEVVTWLDR